MDSRWLSVSLVKDSRALIRLGTVAVNLNRTQAGQGDLNVKQQQDQQAVGSKSQTQTLLSENC